MRRCDDCRTEMRQGYVIDAGVMYLCETCHPKHYTPEQWDAEYADGESESYWTEWTDGDAPAPFDGASVPTLPDTPTWAEAVGYLRWLADSPWCYHLDDDPADFGFPAAVGVALGRNEETLARNFAWYDLWAVYAPKSDPSGRA